jgi:hypothetical protein
MSDLSHSFRIQPRSSGRAFLVAKCDHALGGECRWPLWLQPATGTMWQWDGNVEAPTINPSIDCKGGCGRHFTLTSGEAS